MYLFVVMCIYLFVVMCMYLCGVMCMYLFVYCVTAQLDNACDTDPYGSMSSNQDNQKQCTLEIRNALTKILHQLLPILISRMVYSEEELVDIGGAEDIADAHLADRKEDIKPIFYQKKSDKGKGNYNDESTNDGDDDNNGFSMYEGTL